MEFRHRSWADDKVFFELEKRRVALVAVDVSDLPHLFPAQAIVTNPELFYVRFHGRNIAGWRSRVIFFNNHVHGQAPQNARMLSEILHNNALTDLVFYPVTKQVNSVRNNGPSNIQAIKA
jgi:uncharacterized protein YecE (DUF72 family)